MQMPNLKTMWKKAALAAVTLGGLLCFGGASSVQAHPVVVVRRRVVIVRSGFYGPHPFYYRHGEVRPVFVEHGWRNRFGYWHRY
jgi:hypothetical protein